MSTRLALVSLVSILVAGAARAEPLRPEEVPAPLKPWVGWVLRGHERERCPAFPGQENTDPDDRLCAWAGKLELVLDATGGHFRQEWEVIAESAVPLPGDGDRWPIEV